MTSKICVTRIPGSCGSSMPDLTGGMESEAEAIELAADTFRKFLNFVLEAGFQI